MRVEQVKAANMGDKVVCSTRAARHDAEGDKNTKCVDFEGV